MTEHSGFEEQRIEDLQRKDLHPVEEARALKRPGAEFNLSQRDLAERLGMSAAAVNQSLRILDLDETVLARVQTSEHVSKSVLLEMVKEPDLRRQMALLDKAEAGELTVRAARQEKGRGVVGCSPQAEKTTSRAQTDLVGSLATQGQAGAPTLREDDTPANIPAQRPAPPVAGPADGLQALLEAEPAVVTIPLPEATVEIHFHRGPATPQKIIAALDSALACTRRKGKPPAPA